MLLTCWSCNYGIPIFASTTTPAADALRATYLLSSIFGDVEIRAAVGHLNPAFLTRCVKLRFGLSLVGKGGAVMFQNQHTRAIAQALKGWVQQEETAQVVLSMGARELGS